MASQPETLFKNRIRPKIEALPRTFVVKIQQQAIRGDPDFILCVNGFPVYMELKRKKKVADPLQYFKLKRAAQAGAIVMLVYPENWGEAYSYLSYLAHHEPSVAVNLDVLGVPDACAVI